MTETVVSSMVEHPSGLLVCLKKQPFSPLRTVVGSIPTPPNFFLVVQPNTFFPTLTDCFSLVSVTGGNSAPPVAVPVARLTLFRNQGAFEPLHVA